MTISESSVTSESSVNSVVQLDFNYLVPRVGNGFQTKIPNLKRDNLILHHIEFDLNRTNQRPEIEVVLNHGGTSLKYLISYFQIFDRINLSDYWYRLADGDDIEIVIRNKSPQQQELKVSYVYKESSGVIIHSSHIRAGDLNLRAGDLKESSILSDLTNGWIPQKLYIKSESLIKNLRLLPKFQIQNASDANAFIDTYQLIDIDEKEVVLDFTDEDLSDILNMLSYYRLEVDFADPEKSAYLLAYGFKS